MDSVCFAQQVKRVEKQSAFHLKKIKSNLLGFITRLFIFLPVNFHVYHFQLKKPKIQLLRKLNYYHKSNEREF